MFQSNNDGLTPFQCFKHSFGKYDNPINEKLPAGKATLEARMKQQLDLQLIASIWDCAKGDAQTQSVLSLLLDMAGPISCDPVKYP